MAKNNRILSIVYMLICFPQLVLMHKNYFHSVLIMLGTRKANCNWMWCMTALWEQRPSGTSPHPGQVIHGFSATANLTQTISDC